MPGSDRRNERFYRNENGVEKVLLPFAVKIGKQPHVNAIKNGFIRLMPLSLAGAMFVLIN
ncbi:hypothetical protein MJN51_36600, partial [Salmonella enterica subsp. enterica serovar Kentucky]|nr:hypothetical protein [Salmonella enterica subsp. enterica serovar Kentucky]